MPATCTEIPVKQRHPDGGHITEVVWRWTSHTDGTVTSAVSTTGTTFTGIILGVKIETGGTDPDGGYTCAFITGEDVTVQTLTGTDGALTYAAAPTVAGHLLYEDILYITIANAGSGKTGISTMYLWTI